MDNLTHTAVGLFLARAGLNRWTPYATPILLLAANAPDVDAVCAAGGSLAYLNHHRHITHSLAALPIMALLPVLLVRLAARRPVRWLGAWAAALIAGASHLALDWTNIYGIRLLLPFSERWLRADLTAVVDLWIWGVLALGVAGPFLSRLVNSEIGSARRGAGHGRGWALFALLFLLFYNGGRWFLHERATAMLESRVYSGQAPARVAAFPSAANPLAWRGVVETEQSYSIHELNLAREFDPSEGTVFHKPDDGPAVDAARASPVFRDFLRFSQWPLLRVLPVAEPEGGRRVEAIDLRFGSPRQPRFVATVTLGPRLEVLGSLFEFGPVQPR